MYNEYNTCIYVYTFDKFPMKTNVSTYNKENIGIITHQLRLVSGQGQLRKVKRHKPLSSIITESYSKE